MEAGMCLFDDTPSLEVRDLPPPSPVTIKERGVCQDGIFGVKKALWYQYRCDLTKAPFLFCALRFRGAYLICMK
jgi:hypothetical protein